MSRFKVGQEITIKEDFEMETMLSDKKIQVKSGDKGFLDSKGLIHYTSGEARGKIQNINDIEVCDYDTENIARIIFHRMDCQFGLGGMLDDYEIGKDYFISEMEDVLSDIL